MEGVPIQTASSLPKKATSSSRLLWFFLATGAGIGDTCFLLFVSGRSDVRSILAACCWAWFAGAPFTLAAAFLLRKSASFRLVRKQLDQKGIPAGLELMVASAIAAVALVIAIVIVGEWVGVLFFAVWPFPALV